MEGAVKTSLLAAAIACISAGTELIRKGDILAGVILIVLGLGLIALYSYMVEQQAMRAAVAKIEKLLGVREEDG